MAINAIAGLGAGLPQLRAIDAVRKVDSQPIPGLPDYKSPATDTFEKSLQLPGEQVTYGPPAPSASCDSCG